MNILGYSWIHFPDTLEQLKKHEVATDISVAFWFRQELLPKNGTFILTVRDVDSWLDDCQTWFESRDLKTLTPLTREVREYLFDGLTFERNRFKDAYYTHMESCCKIADQLGVELHQWNVTADPTWEFLFRLTGKQTDKPFPFNPGVYAATWQAVQKQQRKEKFMNFLRRIKQSIKLP